MEKATSIKAIKARLIMRKAELEAEFELLKATEDWCMKPFIIEKTTERGSQLKEIKWVLSNL